MAGVNFLLGVTFIDDVTALSHPCVIAATEDSKIAVWDAEVCILSYFFQLISFFFQNCVVTWEANAKSKISCITQISDNDIACGTAGGDFLVYRFGRERINSSGSVKKASSILLTELGKYIGETDERGEVAHGFGEHHATGMPSSCYIGHWKRGKRHGYGIEIDETRGSFFGSWKDDEKKAGVLVRPDGSTFCGPFIDGQPNGIGRLVMPTGQTITGKFMGTTITNGDFLPGKKQIKYSIPESGYLIFFL